MYSSEPSSMDERDAQRAKEENEAKMHPITLNGKKITIGHLFPEGYAAKDFHAKVKLLEAGDKKQGTGQPDNEGEEAARGEQDNEGLEDQLFGGPGKGKSTKE